MRRALLVCLSLVLALVGWSTVYAQDGFYVIPAMKGKYAPLPKTGQTTTYAPRDDGALQKGGAWPTPRFTDNKNGTVTDNLTGLIWLKNANAFGLRTWDQALSDANNLKSGDAGLTDGSQAGDWRLPNLRELQSLIDYGRYLPALPADHPFTSLESDRYYSSTTSADNANEVWSVDFYDGLVSTFSKNGSNVWCVRGGQ